MIVPERDGGSLWARPGSHGFVYHKTSGKRTLASILYIELVYSPPLSDFSATDTSSAGGRIGTGRTEYYIRSTSYEVTYNLGTEYGLHKESV